MADAEKGVKPFAGTEFEPTPKAAGETPCDPSLAEACDAAHGKGPALWPDRFVPLSFARARDLGWRLGAMAQPSPTILLPEEIMTAAAQVPIGFRRLGASALGQAYLPAPGLRLSFRPEIWSFYPFGLGMTGAGVAHVTIDSGALAPLGELGVAPLFDAGGALLPRYAEQIAGLEMLVPRVAQAAAVVAPWAAGGEALAELWPEGGVCLSHRLIAPEVLTRLTRAETGEHHASGALAFAYAAVLSRQHLPAFCEGWRRAIHQGPAALRTPRRPATTVESFLTALGHDLNLF